MTATLTPPAVLRGYRSADAALLSGPWPAGELLGTVTAGRPALAAATTVAPPADRTTELCVTPGVGYVRFCDIDRIHRRARLEIGTADPDAAGPLLRAAVDHASDVLGLHRLYGRVTPGVGHPGAALAAAGFAREVTVPDALWLDGRPVAREVWGWCAGPVAARAGSPPVPAPAAGPAGDGDGAASVEPLGVAAAAAALGAAAGARGFLGLDPVTQNEALLAKELTRMDAQVFRAGDALLGVVAGGQPRQAVVASTSADPGPVRALLRFAAGYRRCTSFVAAVTAGDPDSAYTGCGFRPAGTLRDHVYRSGRYHDVRVLVRPGEELPCRS